MSTKSFYFDSSEEKKDKFSFKNPTVLQKYLSNNHLTKKDDESNNKAKLVDSYKSVTFQHTHNPLNDLKQRQSQQIQSKLPVTVQRQVNGNTKVPVKKFPIIKKPENQQEKSSQIESNKNFSNNFGSNLRPRFQSNEYSNKNEAYFKDESSGEESSSSDDEKISHLSKMLERFRNSKPMSRDYRPNLSDERNGWFPKSRRALNDENDIIESSNSEYKIDENDVDIANLKDRLNDLRRKIFTSLDMNNENDLIDNNENNETILSNSNELDLNINDQLPPLKPKPLGSIRPTFLLNETNKKFSSNQSEKLKNSKSTDLISSKNINIESLDMKAKQLIERSESSLVNRMVSSDGVASSGSSSISSTISSNFQDTQPYKPEFLKYLENKTKLGYSPETGDPLKPEEDILYQWRLQRKLEEAKKSGLNYNQNHIIENQIQTNSETVKHQIETNKKNENQIHQQLKSASFFDSNKSTKEVKSKQSIETQTNNLIDLAVQTSLASSSDLKQALSNIYNNQIVEENKQNQNDDEMEINLENEEPTRDKMDDSFDMAIILENNKKNFNSNSIQNSNLSNRKSSSNKTKSKSNFLSSSPIRNKSSKHIFESNTDSLQSQRSSIESNYQISSKNLNNISADLTKVSSINENTPSYAQLNPPRSSNSPISFTNNNNQIKSKISSISQDKQLSLLSSIPSTSSTLTYSSINNITNSLQSQQNASNNNPNHLKETQLDKTITISKDQITTEKYDEYEFNSQVDSDNYEQNENEMFESDEILKILFKKTYFYQLKLKQIDELLSK